MKSTRRSAPPATNDPPTRRRRTKPRQKPQETSAHPVVEFRNLRYCCAGSRFSKERAMADPSTLAIDIGGTGLKMALLDGSGQMIGERVRVPTPPKPVGPDVLVRALAEAATQVGPFDRVSVG